MVARITNPCTNTGNNVADSKQFEVDTSDLINNLKLFNAKERFFLVGHILGNRDFRPSDCFIDQLSNLLGIDIPTNVFAAMDYHLDWLYASLVRTQLGKQINYLNPPVSEDDQNGPGIVQGNQEDLDFVIAFNSDGKCHIVILEAKGVTGWTNSQMASKVKRLKAIFGHNQGVRFLDVVPHFVMISPKLPSDNIKTEGWPEWMLKDNKPIYMEMPIPKNLLAVSRCDGEGIKSADGKSWCVYERNGVFDTESAG